MELWKNQKLDFCPYLSWEHEVAPILFLFLLLLLLFFFLAVPHVMWDLSTLIGDLLVPQPGLEPMPPASEAQSLNYWTIRKVSKFNLLMSIICLKKKRSFEIRNIQAWILIPPFSCGTLDGSLILLENRDNNASLIYHDISWYNIPSN